MTLNHVSGAERDIFVNTEDKSAMPPHRPAMGTVSRKRIERVKMAETLWVRGFKKWQVLDALVEAYGIARGTARNDFGFARKRLRAEAQIQSKGDLQKRVADGFLEVLRTAPRHADKTRALEALAKLYGLNDTVPMQTTPAEVEVSLIDWRQSFRQMRDENMVLTSSSGGNGAAPGGNGTHSGGNGTAPGK